MAGQIVTIAQQKGGTGKTTLAANLAVAMMMDGRDVAILDTDPQGSLGRWFMTRAGRFGDDDPDMGFRTASAWGARYEARQLAKSHDLVIIDTPPKMGTDGRPAIETADLVIVPITPSRVDLWATFPTIEMAKAEKKPVLIVLNKASTRTRITAEIREAIGEFDCICAETLLASRVALAETAGAGYGVAERHPSHPATAEIRALAAEINALLGK